MAQIQKKTPAKPKQASRAKAPAAATKSRLIKVGNQQANRQVKLPKYNSFRLNKRIKVPGAKIPSVFSITKEAYLLSMSRWRIFTGVLLIYAALYAILVSGVSSGLDIAGISREVKAESQGLFGIAAASLTGLGVIVGSSANDASVQASSGYQLVLFIVGSLAIIWTLRQVQAGVRVGLRETYYKSMAPLVPFFCVLVIMAVQLLPLIIANFIFGIVVIGGIAVYLIEKVLWMILVFLLIIWTFYMLANSFIALYIATLPDITPWQAITSAQKLVEHRRWTVLRKLLFLPLLVAFVYIVVMLPVITFIPTIAEYVFFGISMVSLLIAHAYIYTLYRKLLA